MRTDKEKEQRRIEALKNHRDYLLNNPAAQERYQKFLKQKFTFYENGNYNEEKYMTYQTLVSIFEEFTQYLISLSQGANIPNSQSAPRFLAIGVKTLTAASYEGNVPNTLSILQFIADGFKTLLAIGTESGYSFKALENYKVATQIKALEVANSTLLKISLIAKAIEWKKKEDLENEIFEKEFKYDISKRENRIILSDSDDFFYECSTKRNKLIRTFKLPLKDKYQGMIVMPDRKSYFVLGGPYKVTEENMYKEESFIYQCDTRSNKCIWKMNGIFCARELLVTYDGEYLIVCSCVIVEYNGNPHCFDNVGYVNLDFYSIETKQLVKRWEKALEDIPLSFCVTHDGKYIITQHVNHYLTVLDIQKYENVQTIKRLSPYRSNNLITYKDSKNVFLEGENTVLTEVQNPSSNIEFRFAELPDFYNFNYGCFIKNARLIGIINGGKYLLYTLDYCSIHKLNLITKDDRKILDYDLKMRHGVKLAKDGRSLLLVGENDLHVFDLKTSKIVNKVSKAWANRYVDMTMI